MFAKISRSLKKGTGLTKKYITPVLVEVTAISICGSCDLTFLFKNTKYQAEVKMHHTCTIGADKEGTSCLPL